MSSEILVELSEHNNGPTISLTHDLTNGPTRLSSFKSETNSQVARDKGEVIEQSMEQSSQEQFEKKKQVTLTSMHRVFVESINAYALVLVLLATVTYSGFMQPPGSFDGDGYIRTYSDSKLILFVYFNSFSFFFSVADLLLCLSGSFAPLTVLNPGMFIRPKTRLGGTNLNFSIEWSNIRTTAPIPEKLYLEQAITHQLAGFVASTLTKLVWINILFTISLTCCVAAFGSAGFAILRPNGAQQMPMIVSSVAGCCLYFVFLIWLLSDSFKFFWRAGFGLVAFKESPLADALAENAGHLSVQLQYSEPPTVHDNGDGIGPFHESKSN